MTAETNRRRSQFEQSRDAVFVLNRHRKLLDANSAFEAFVGVPLADIRGMVCSRRSSAHPFAALGRTISPTPEVLAGQSVRVHRPPPGSEQGPPWWIIEFLPLAGAEGAARIIGRIVTNALQSAIDQKRVMPESWAGIRAEAADRYRLAMIGDVCPALRPAVAQARFAARTNAPVTLLGERGSGKKWLARAIHLAGPRQSLPFIALDCAALPFDAVRGVLRGPLGLEHPDWLGTLYLRHPDALPETMQTELTQWLEDRPDDGIGFVAAYEIEPAEPLGTLPIQLPSLRERRQDFPWLVPHLLERTARRTGRKTVPVVSADAWECLRAYAWPENVTELASVLATAIDKAGDHIDVGDLPLVIRQARVASDSPQRREEPLPKLDDVLEKVERRLIALALKKSGGNQSQAAEMLGVWRPRLIRRIKALGLDGSEPEGEAQQ